jgi:hypothetical protein
VIDFRTEVPGWEESKNVEWFAGKLIDVLGEHDVLPVAVGIEDNRYLYLVFPRGIEAVTIGDTLRQCLIDVQAEAAAMVEREQRRVDRSMRPATSNPSL